jgi:hypothetical protein
MYDPLINFDPTLEVLQKHFANVDTVRLTYPFHQPPAPFTYNELNRDFYNTVDSFLQIRNKETITERRNWLPVFTLA